MDIEKHEIIESAKFCGSHGTCVGCPWDKDKKVPCASVFAKFISECVECREIEKERSYNIERLISEFEVFLDERDKKNRQTKMKESQLNVER